MTETTSQITTLSLREWPEVLATVGRPLPFVRVEVRGPDARPLGPGEEGEIFVRGPMVVEGYFDEPERNASAFDRRWFRTGDFGVWDGAGRLRVLDRRQDRMVVGGENVAAGEVEEALARHPGIAEVCVVALPAGSWGHEVTAVVVRRPGSGVTLEELRELAGRTLAPHKLPRRLFVLETLPRNSAGKLLRGEIRSRLAEEMAEKNRA
jgi:acyl-CoA synthetase (AMP-forming)/AMP-acid ligase II